MKLFVGNAERAYDLASVEDVPLWAMVRIEKELGLSADSLGPFLEEAMAAVQSGELSGEPRLIMAVGLMVWMTRMTANERIGFEDACDFPMRSLRIEATDAERAAADQASATATATAEKTAALVEGGQGVRPTSPAAGTPAAG